MLKPENRYCKLYPPSVHKLNWSMFFYRKTEIEINNFRNLIVKASKNVAALFLSFLMNRSFESIFISAFRQAKTIPIHKHNFPLDENKYRHISLLFVWSKIHKRAMYNQISL